jgi:hypothetical protein
MMQGGKVLGFLLASVWIGCLAPVAWGAQFVGRTQRIEKVAEALGVGRPAWQSLSVQQELFLRDQLRTQASSKVEVLFIDDSTLTLGENSQITVDEQIVQPLAASTGVVNLVQGIMRAVVSDRYQKPGGRFEVRTPTAVAGVRGTSFISRCQVDTCLFLGLNGRVAVESLAFPGQPVFLTAGLFTEVKKGQLPTPPRQMAEREMAVLVAMTTIPVYPAQEALVGAVGTAIVGAIIYGTGEAFGVFDKDNERRISSPSQ